MKPVDKKDLPKLIVLIVVSVGVFGWFMVSMLTSSPAPANATAAQKAEAEKAQEEAAAADTTAPEDQPFDVSSVRLLTGGKDPFIPNGPAVPESALGVAVPLPTTPAPATPLPYKPRVGGKGLGNIFGTNKNYVRPGAEFMNSTDAPTGNAGTGNVAPVVVPPPPPPTAPVYTVTGVIMGQDEEAKSVAILRGGSEGERRYVSAGDEVGNGYVVSKVTPSGVELKLKGTKHSVTMPIGKANAEEKSRAK